MAALHGVGVLVTRPELQAAPLCRLFEAAGATTLRLPAIDIEAVRDAGTMALELRAAGPFDLVIVTSANAVRFGAPLLCGHGIAALAAIGPATARALHQAGHPATVIPAGGFDSEALLRDPALERLEGRSILIVTGMHGRPYLGEQLALRGARVVSAEVYRRARVRHDAATLTAMHARLAAGEIQVITATSVDIAAALLDTAAAELRREFQRVQWLVPGARAAAAIRELGVTAPLLLAGSAQDQDLVSAVVRWRSTVS